MRFMLAIMIAIFSVGCTQKVPGKIQIYKVAASRVYETTSTSASDDSYIYYYILTVNNSRYYASGTSPSYNGASWSTTKPTQQLDEKDLVETELVYVDPIEDNQSPEGVEQADQNATAEYGDGGGGE